VAIVALPAPARADGDVPATPVEEASAIRPHGMAEFGAGLLTLPNAEVCVERAESGCSQGDTSLELDAWQLYRPAPVFAFGAGLTLGLTPTTDVPRKDPPGLSRDHSRRYLTIEATARWYAMSDGELELWGGLTGGAVVLSDAFKTVRQSPEAAVIGPRAQTIRSEGWTIGAALGLAWRLGPSWSLGTTLRYATWNFPDEPERDAFGDEASLSGDHAVFDVGVNVGYRVAL
jgi:hypothetical protein